MKLITRNLNYWVVSDDSNTVVGGDGYNGEDSSREVCQYKSYT